MAIATKILISPAEKAAEIGVSTETLFRWRRDGVGPDWKQFSPQVIRYWPEAPQTEVAA
jgi:hypothetical protein